MVRGRAIPELPLIPEFGVQGSRDVPLNQLLRYLKQLTKYRRA